MSISKITSSIKRIQYQTSDNSSSSLTIDQTLFEALDKKMDNANDWCKAKGREVRTLLEEEALELEARGELVKMKGGKVVKITTEDYVRGKISSGLRQLVIHEVIDKKYL